MIYELRLKLETCYFERVEILLDRYDFALYYIVRGGFRAVFFIEQENIFSFEKNTRILLLWRHSD